MKKLYIIFIVSLILFSCSSDDNNTKADENGGNIPVDQKLLQSVNPLSSDPMNIIYNQDKTVKRVTLGNGTAGSLIFDFKYENGNIFQVTGISGGESETIYFEHQNSIITSFKRENDDVVVAVTYNPATKTYAYNDDQEEIVLKLTEDGDLEKFTNEQHADDNFLNLFVEDDSKFGPMHNANNVSPYLVMAFPGFTIFAAFLTKRPVEVASFNAGTLYFTNEYFSDGFLKKADLFVNNEARQSSVYKYTSLQAGN